MDSEVEVPELETVQVFRTVMEEEFRKHREMLQDLPEDTAGSFARRLAAICNCVSEGLLRNVTYQTQAYKERETGFATALTLNTDAKEDIASETQLESRKLQSRLHKALEAAKTQAQQLTAAFLSDLKEKQSDEKPGEALSVPDLEPAMQTACRELQFERALKDRALKTLAAIRSLPQPQSQPLSGLEVRVYEKLYWSP